MNINTKNPFENLILKTFEGMPFEARIEEDPEDIDFAVCYNYHGDEYVFIKTKDDKKYEYGYYLNLRYADETYIMKSDLYIRKPKTYMPINSSASNEIYRKISWFFDSQHGHRGNDRSMFSMDDNSTNQWDFNYLVAGLEEGYEAENGFYDYEKYRKEIELVLKNSKNDIYTEKNIEKVSHLKLKSKLINGANGIMSKKISDDDSLSVDKIIFVYRNGRFLNEDEYIVTCRGFDSFGMDERYFELDQFNNDVLENNKLEILEKINEIKGRISSLEERLPNLTLKETYNVIDLLSEVCIPVNFDNMEDYEDEDYVDDEDEEYEE